jgi:hypothetical protein
VNSENAALKDGATNEVEFSQASAASRGELRQANKLFKRGQELYSQLKLFPEP